MIEKLTPAPDLFKESVRMLLIQELVPQMRPRGRRYSAATLQDQDPFLARRQCSRKNRPYGPAPNYNGIRFRHTIRQVLASAGRIQLVGSCPNCRKSYPSSGPDQSPELDQGPTE